MDKIIEAMLSVMLCVFLAAVLSGIVTANIDASRAKSYHSNVIQELEAGNMADNVIDGCISTANDNGYTLNVDKYENDDGKTVICAVVLSYKYNIPVLNISTIHQCRGFAR
jgi:hypothetical protein